MKKTVKTVTFEDRVRFNWGFHDAVLAVRQGWATAEKNFGFATALKIGSVDAVLTQHFDGVYARGWTFGYQAALAGNDCTSSEPAWQNAVQLGQVSE